MLVASFEMAQRLKEADTLHLARQVEPCSQLFTDQGIVAKPVGHGLAAVTLPEFGRKLNHIAGFEMAGQVSSEDLRIVENFHSKMGLDTEIEFCLHADTSAVQVLTSHGYAVNVWVNNYVRALSGVDLHDGEFSGIKISQLARDRRDQFPSTCLAGF